MCFHKIWIVPNKYINTFSENVHACVLCCARACFFSSLSPVWDLLVSDMPPSAWLLIAPGKQESRTSGTDIADGDRKHGAERSPLNTVLWLQAASVRDDRRTEPETDSRGQQRTDSVTRTRWLWLTAGDREDTAPLQRLNGWCQSERQLELNGYYLTCLQVGPAAAPVTTHQHQSLWYLIWGDIMITTVH